MNILSDDKNMEIILRALEYSLWNDRDHTSEDETRIKRLLEILEAE